MPMAAGTWRGEPFTKMVRCAWMWNSTCSLVSQWMPSTGWPAVLTEGPASGGALGTGTPSGPFGPGGGAGLSVPSVLSELSFGDAVAEPLLAEPPEVAARAMPTAAPATITTAPSAISQRCRRRRRASAALACAIFSRACCCLFLLLLDTAPFPDRATGWRAERRAAASTASTVYGLPRRQYCLASSTVMVLL